MANSAAKFAEDYGYALSFLKSDKELYGIFQKAMKGEWDATKFVAAVKNSNWYKKHGEAYRTNLALKTTDPGTYNQNLNQQRATIGALAGTMGATLTTAQITQLAENATMFGWNDQQIRNTLAQYLKPGASTGNAGTLRQQLRQAAYRNGATPSEATIDSWVKRITVGGDTIESLQQQIRDVYGSKLAPGFAQELKAGMDLSDIAAPYMQTMAQTLELNPADVDLFDPTIRQAMGTSDAGDGKPGSVPLWQFEQNLRQDSRFMQTKSAQDQSMSVGKKVLADFGLVN